MDLALPDDVTPSPWLRHFELPPPAPPAPAPPVDDAVLHEFRGLFVELYRLVWSLQRDVAPGQTPDLLLREHRDLHGELTHATLTSVRHAHYLGRVAVGARNTLLSLAPIARRGDGGHHAGLVAVRVEPIGSVLVEDLRVGYGEPVLADNHGAVFAELSFRMAPDVFMGAVVRQLLALGVRPGEAA